MGGGEGYYVVYVWRRWVLCSICVEEKGGIMLSMCGGGGYYVVYVWRRRALCSLCVEEKGIM